MNRQVNNTDQAERIRAAKARIAKTEESIGRQLDYEMSGHACDYSNTVKYLREAKRDAVTDLALIERGDVWEFIGLYEGSRRVAAILVEVDGYNPWDEPKQYWQLSEDESDLIARNKRREEWLIPVGITSRIQRQLGLCERVEVQAAERTPGRVNTMNRAVVDGNDWNEDAVALHTCRPNPAFFKGAYRVNYMAMALGGSYTNAGRACENEDVDHVGATEAFGWEAWQGG